MSRGTNPDVCHAGEPALVQKSFNGIDAVWRELFAVRGQVGCGKADLASETVAGNDSPEDGVFAAEQARRGGEVTGLDQRANLGAAYGLAVDLHGGDADFV